MLHPVQRIQRASNFLSLISKKADKVNRHRTGTLSSTHLPKTPCETVMLMSQAAACDGLVYSVDYNGQNSGTQANALPLFED